MKYEKWWLLNLLKIEKSLIQIKTKKHKNIELGRKKCWQTIFLRSIKKNGQCTRPFHFKIDLVLKSMHAVKKRLKKCVCPIELKTVRPYIHVNNVGTHGVKTRSSAFFTS